MRILIMLLIICTISISGCGNKNEIVDNRGNKSDTVVQANDDMNNKESIAQTNDDINNKTDANVENDSFSENNIENESVSEENAPSFKESVLEINGYSDGVSWIKYTSDNGVRDAIMDKDGNILVKFSDDTLVYKTDFINGSAYIQLENGESYLIDKNGNKLFSPSKNGLTLPEKWGEYLPYGDGYYCFHSRYESFDEAYTTITIIDAKGEVVSATKAEGKDYYDIYVGSGIFAYAYYFIRSQGYFINALTGEEFEFDGTSSYCSLRHRVDFSDGVKVVDDEGWTKLLYTDGTIEELNLPEWAGTYLATKEESHEGKILIYDYVVSAATSSNKILHMGLYDVNSKKFIELEKYLNKMDDEYLKENNKKVVNDRIVLPMRGADGGWYFAVFDSEWNEIIAPTIGVRDHLNVAYSCNRLIINTEEGDIVYDEDGNIVFKASDLGLDTFQNQPETKDDDNYISWLGNSSDVEYYTASYKDNVLVTKDLRVIDLDGTVLFEDINDSMAYEFEY